MFLNVASSTTLGSIRIRLTSRGVLVIRNDMTMLAMHTLLPEPVVPAISRCGMRVRSDTIGWPAASLPR